MSASKDTVGARARTHTHTHTRQAGTPGSGARASTPAPTHTARVPLSDAGTHSFQPHSARGTCGDVVRVQPMQQQRAVVPRTVVAEVGWCRQRVCVWVCVCVGVKWAMRQTGRQTRAWRGVCTCKTKVHTRHATLHMRHACTASHVSGTHRQCALLCTAAPARVGFR
jgi:hypothetical protein